MDERLSAWRAGFVLSIVTGGFHLGWTILVWLGWAQPVIDFVLWAHFIRPIYVIEPFNIGRAVLLVAMTTGSGLITGSVFAAVWNALRS